MKLKRRTNLREIGQKIGISASTVSRALRELPGIHPETRKQVFETAKELGYHWHQQQQEEPISNILTLSQGVASDTDHEYLSGISRASVPMNMSVISHHCRPEECANVLKKEFQPRALTAGQVDGIVLIHRWPMEVAQALREKFPVVSIIHDYPGTDIDVVALDDRGGMDLLISDLKASGYLRIGFFGLCSQMTWSRSRFAGFIDAAIEHGCWFRLEDVVNVTLEEAMAETEFEGGTAMSKALELTRCGVDAWVCPSELTANSLYARLREAGFSIPEQVAVTGFHCTRKPGLLTTTTAPTGELGCSALRTLVHRIENKNSCRRMTLIPCGFFKGMTTR